MYIRLPVAIVILLVFIAPAWHAVPCHGQGGPLSATVVNPPLIDGRRSPGEWDEAAQVFVFPDALEGSVLFVMNDASVLYLAALVADDSLDATDRLEFRFDNDRNGTLDDFDNNIQLTVNGLSDLHFLSNFGWGPFDARQHGIGAAGRAGAFNFFEIAFPLRSGDSMDFDLVPGEMVGLCMRYFKEGASSSELVHPGSCQLAVNGQSLYTGILIADGREHFERGDANQDGHLSIGDVALVDGLLRGGIKARCLDAVDANDDGVLDLADALVIWEQLIFGIPLPPPRGGPGIDPTEDNLSCDNYFVTPPRLDPAVILELEPITVPPGGQRAATVRLSSPASVRAFSLGVGHDADVVRATDVRILPEIEKLAVNGFVVAQAVNGGAVAAVHLELGTPASIPAAADVAIVAIFYEAVGAAGSSSPLAFTETLRAGRLGPPVANRVVKLDLSEEVIPAMVDGSVSIEEPPGPLFNYTLEAPKEVAGRPGASVTLDVFSLIGSDRLGPGDEGAQGWVISAGVEGCDVVDVTTEGTLVPELLTDGFQSILVATDGPAPAGFVSSVLLGLRGDVTLPTESPQRVLRATLRGRVPPADCVPCRVFHVDGMVGGGEPHTNSVARLGGLSRPALGEATAQLCAGDFPADFIRCDPNGNGRNEPADAMWIFNELFFGGPPATCRDAADCNGDRNVDISDILFVVNYQFLGGPAPPAPFPSCGLAAGVNSESCPPGSTVCP